MYIYIYFWYIFLIYFWYISDIFLIYFWYIYDILWGSSLHVRIGILFSPNFPKQTPLHSIWSPNLPPNVSPNYTILLYVLELASLSNISDICFFFIFQSKHLHKSICSINFKSLPSTTWSFSHIRRGLAQKVWNLGISADQLTRWPGEGDQVTKVTR